MHNEITEKRGYPLPHCENYLEDDVERLRDAVSAIDLDIAEVAEEITKAVDNQVPATSEKAGLMSKEDKAALDALAPLKSLKTFGEIRVGENKLLAALLGDFLEVAAGENVTLSLDAATRKLTINSKGGGWGGEGIDIVPDKPTITSPINGATIGEKSVTIHWTYSNSSGIPQGGARVQVTTPDGATTLYDSGLLGPVLFHTIPSTILVPGNNYGVRVLTLSVAGGQSQWADRVVFGTAYTMATVFGVAAVAANNVYNINIDGNFIFPAKQEFNQHRIYAGMTDVLIDGQDIVKIPKHYVKRGTGPAGTHSMDGQCWWVSDSPLPDFWLPPAYKITTGSGELDYLLIGKYEACVDGTDKLGSLAGKESAVNMNFATALAKAAARGIGWHMWDMQELAVIQWLALIELASFDVQAKIAAGPTTKPLTGGSNVVYRGIHGLWRHILQWTNGANVPGSPYNMWLFSEDGSRTLTDTGTQMAPAINNTWPTSFYKTGLLRNHFFAAAGVGDEASAMCKDFQILRGTGTASQYMRVGGHYGQNTDAGLWHMEMVMQSTLDANTGTRIAKR